MNPRLLWTILAILWVLIIAALIWLPHVHRRLP